MYIWDWAIKRHASDTIHVVGLAMGQDWLSAQIPVKIYLYDSNMTLLKTVGPFYNLGERATKNDTHVHPFYIKPTPIVGSNIALLTFVYFDDGPIDVVGDYYLSPVEQDGADLMLITMGESHTDPPFLIENEVRHRMYADTTTWISDTTGFIPFVFPIITPPCDTIEWASAAMEGDSVVRVQWDSTVDEVQVCLMPMGETPDSTGVFVRDTTAFDTVVSAGNYDVYVRRVCNERYLVCSDWTGPLTVRSSPINPDPEDPPEGISEVAGAVGFTLRPNPAREEVTLEGGAWMAGGVLTVTDMRGTEVVRRKVESGRLTLDVSRLPKGAYTVSVTTGEGTAARRLVVQ